MSHLLIHHVRRTIVSVLAIPAVVAPVSLCAQEATPGLRQLARPFFSVGVGVRITEHPADRELLTRHFEGVTPENCMKVQHVQNVEGQFRFETADRFVQFASEQNLSIVGHCLVWAKDDRTPAWFYGDGAASASAELLLARMKTHITTVMNRYKDKVATWDVVNEALADGPDGYLRDSGWSRATGEEFIVKAFEYAHAVDPEAFLIYNDYRCDTVGKRHKLIRLARMLKARKAPVDAIGLQGHYELDSVPYEGLEAMLQAMRELGLKVVVSELDIDVVKRGRWWAEGGRYRADLASYDPYRTGCPPEILRRQAEQYAQLFRLLVKYQDVIERVSFWNLHDGQSWLNYFPWRRVNHPLLFDRQRQPKPAFEAVASVLAEASKTPR